MCGVFGKAFCEQRDRLEHDHIPCAMARAGALRGSRRAQTKSAAATTLHSDGQRPRRDRLATKCGGRASARKKCSKNKAVREKITYSAWALVRGVPDYRHIHAPEPLHNKKIVWGLWKRRSASKAQVVHEKTEWNDCEGLILNQCVHSVWESCRKSSTNRAQGLRGGLGVNL